MTTEPSRPAPRTYLDDIADAIRSELPAKHTFDADLGREYALVLLLTGETTTAQHVHDAWAVHTQRTRPDHRYLVRWDDLPAEVQEMDEPFAAAIRRAAAKLENRNG